MGFWDDVKRFFGGGEPRGTDPIESAVRAHMIEWMERGRQFSPVNITDALRRGGHDVAHDTVADVKAAVAELSGAGKVGLVGYCWGGSVAWVAAVRAGLDCSVGYYGGRIIDFVGETPTCPVIGP